MNIIWKYAEKPEKSLHKIRAYDRRIYDKNFYDSTVIHDLFESYMGHATLF